MQKVKDIMTKKVVIIPDDMEIECICNVLINNSLSGAPVMNNKGKLIGFVSERDIVAAIASGDFANLEAKDIMCKKVTKVREDTPLTEVSKIFAGKPFRHLPVVRRGEVIGIISRKDIIGRLLVP